MSKRALLFLGIYGIALVAALVFPPAGVWGYLFEWYNHPPFHWWGKPLYSIGARWSLYIGVAMVAGLILHYGKYSNTDFIKHPQTKLILFYTLNAYIVSFFSVITGKSLEVAIEHTKVFLLYWCIVKTQSERRYLLITLIICIIGCANWGLDVTLNKGLGIGGPGAYGENFASPHVIAFLPLVGLFALTEKGWLRWLCLLSAPFIVNIPAYSQSRGAFLALIVAGISIAIFSRRKLRWYALLLLLLGSIVCLRLFNVDFWERQQTVITYKEDSSAMGRIYAWKAAWLLVQDNPFGYGGEAFDSGLGAQLMPLGFHTTHNMFFEVFVAWGIQGVIFIFGFIFLTCRDCFRLYKNYWDSSSWPPPREAMIALGILCGICSMLVASMFLNRYRWELWWVFGALTVCLKNIHADTVNINGNDK